MSFFYSNEPTNQNGGVLLNRTKTVYDGDPGNKFIKYATELSIRINFGRDNYDLREVNIIQELQFLDKETCMEISEEKDYSGIIIWGLLHVSIDTETGEKKEQYYPDFSISTTRTYLEPIRAGSVILRCTSENNENTYGDTIKKVYEQYKGKQEYHYVQPWNCFDYKLDTNIESLKDTVNNLLINGKTNVQPHARLYESLFNVDMTYQGDVYKMPVNFLKDHRKALRDAGFEILITGITKKRYQRWEIKSGQFNTFYASLFDGDINETNTKFNIYHRSATDDLNFLKVMHNLVTIVCTINDEKYNKVKEIFNFANTLDDKKKSDIKMSMDRFVEEMKHLDENSRSTLRDCYLIHYQRKSENRKGATYNNAETILVNMLRNLTESSGIKNNTINMALTQYTYNNINNITNRIGHNIYYKNTKKYDNYTQRYFIEKSRDKFKDKKELIHLPQSIQLLKSTEFDKCVNAYYVNVNLSRYVYIYIVRSDIYDVSCPYSKISHPTDDHVYFIDFYNKEQRDVMFDGLTKTFNININNEYFKIFEHIRTNDYIKNTYGLNRDEQKTIFNDTLNIIVRSLKQCRNVGYNLQVENRNINLLAHFFGDMVTQATSDLDYICNFYKDEDTSAFELYTITNYDFILSYSSIWNKNILRDTSGRYTIYKDYLINRYKFFSFLCCYANIVTFANAYISNTDNQDSEYIYILINIMLISVIDNGLNDVSLSYNNSGHIDKITFKCVYANINEKVPYFFQYAFDVYYNINVWKPFFFLNTERVPDSSFLRFNKLSLTDDEYYGNYITYNNKCYQAHQAFYGGMYNLDVPVILSILIKERDKLTPDDILMMINYLYHNHDDKFTDFKYITNEQGKRIVLKNTRDDNLELNTYNYIQQNRESIITKIIDIVIPLKEEIKSHNTRDGNITSLYESWGMTLKAHDKFFNEKFLVTLTLLISDICTINDEDTNLYKLSSLYYLQELIGFNLSSTLLNKGKFEHKQNIQDIVLFKNIYQYGTDNYIIRYMTISQLNNNYNEFMANKDKLLGIDNILKLYSEKIFKNNAKQNIRTGFIIKLANQQQDNSIAYDGPYKSIVNHPSECPSGTFPVKAIDGKYYCYLKTEKNLEIEKERCSKILESNCNTKNTGCRWFNNECIPTNSKIVDNTMSWYQGGGYYEKYTKYKLKYLELKEKLVYNINNRTN